MYCSQCGKALPNEAAVCDGCGAVFNTAQFYTPPPPAYTNTAFGQPAQTMPPRLPFEPMTMMPQNLYAPLSVGQYIGMFLLLCIPMVNIILLLIWAFDGNSNINKKNFARAYLIISIIGFVFSVISLIIFGGMMFELFEEMGEGYYF